MSSRKTDEYVDRCCDRILELLLEHHALVHPEIEARVSEGYYRSSNRNIDPHHVTTALRNLTKREDILRLRTTTRGGRAIETVQLTHPPSGTSTVVARAAARRRLLYARYQGWAQGTVHNPQGLIGPAGEVAVRLGLQNSGALQPAVPGFAEVRSLLGSVLTGPLDSAGFLVPILHGLPQTPITILVEVKNIRSWVYPSSAEPYQLLAKAARLQQDHPTQPIIPMLICRRAHPTLFWMAQQLGFVVIELEAQFAGDVPADSLDEVRTELAFSDLRIGTGPSIRVAERLRSEALLAKTPEIADTWATTAQAPIAGQAILAAKASRDWSSRLSPVEALRAWNTSRGQQGGW